EQDARDVATYIFSLSALQTSEDVSFMDDPKLAEDGKAEIKQYGCAGCHEIKGFEEEQRIGKELTTEGATPLERLDFALLTQDAEYGRDPLQLHPNDKEKEWYNHRGFFEHKLSEPKIYDTGKSKYLEPKDRLRMPKPYLTEEWRTGLTTVLLGSVGAEGANVPASLFYNPQDARRQDIQNGWWVIKKYNCMGCHVLQPGEKPTAPSSPSPTTSASPAAQAKPSAAANDQTGGRLQPQPGANRNGVRPYIQVHMPTFNFSPNELRVLVRFFMAVSSQNEPYIKEPMDPMTESEKSIARNIFVSGTPCLKCHITGEPAHDAKAIAPNF